MCEGQVVSNQVCSEEVLLEIFSYVGLIGNITQEYASRFLVTKVEKPRVVLVGIGFKIKHIVDLVLGRHRPFFVIVKDIEC